MKNKTIMIGLVALAFVAGSIMTTNLAEAAKGEPKGQPFQALFDTIEDIQEQIDTIESASGNTYTNKITEALDAGSKDFIEVYCDEGDKATGGGGSQSSGFANLVESHPIDDVNQVAIGWNATFTNQVGFDPLITAYVVCLDS